VLVLPISFSGYGSVGISGAGGPMDSLQGVIGSTNRMSGDMGSCYRLTCGTSGRASRIIRSYFTGGGMGCKRSLAYISHLEHPCIDPCLACFDSFSRSIVFWIILLKIGQNTLNTINCPDGQSFVVSFSHKLYH